MDLRVLVLSADLGLAELLGAQVENLGCQCNIRASYDEAQANIAWADAAIVDLAGSGLDDLSRLGVEAPRVRVLAVAPDAASEEGARSAGAHHVIREPFSIADLVTVLRTLAPKTDAKVIDLRSRQVTEAPVVDDAPWFSTR